MVSRRTFLAVGSAFLATPRAAGAQQAGKVYRIGVFVTSQAAAESQFGRAFCTWGRNARNA